jgi:hypothetical protein
MQNKATKSNNRRKTQHNTRTSNTQFDQLVPSVVCSFCWVSSRLYRALAASSRSICSRRSLFFTFCNAQGPALLLIGKKRWQWGIKSLNGGNADEGEGTQREGKKKKFETNG